ncbi:MAG: fatty acid desaturase [Patescibacteria group bacterium]
MLTYQIDSRSRIFDERMRGFLKLYFKNIKRTGNWKLRLKATIFLSSLFGLISLLALAKQHWLLVVIECIVLGVVISGIGFCVMHDASHRSFSDKKWVNSLLGLTLNLLGGDIRIWKQQHEIDHHMHTNVDGKDGDIDLGKFGRMHPSQKRYPWHKYQHIYLPWFGYPISYFLWVYYFDFIKAKKMGFKFWQYVSMVFSKSIHVAIFIGFPALFHGLVPVIIGYMIASLVAGTITSFVFQLAHVVELTEMFDAPEDGIIKKDSVHQLKTTANFATKNKKLSWYVGGLNFQREHHLFYQYSHVHYPVINKEVKIVTRDLGLPDHEYPGLWSAVKSHIARLKFLGNND